MIVILKPYYKIPEMTIEIPILETNRLLLRNFKIDDAEEIYNYLKDPDISKFFPWETPKSVNDVINLLSFSKTKNKNNFGLDLAIVLKANKKVIGGCGFDKIDHAHKWGEIGYVISKEYWNQGIATEALKELILFGFKTMDLNRIEAVCITDNKASEKVMIKLGMKFDSNLRGRFYSKKNYYDAKMYYLLKKEK